MTTHPFVSTPIHVDGQIQLGVTSKTGKCSSCGKSKNHAIHKVSSLPTTYYFDLSFQAKKILDEMAANEDHFIRGSSVRERTEAINELQFAGFIIHAEIHTVNGYQLSGRGKELMKGRGPAAVPTVTMASHLSNHVGSKPIRFIDTDGD